MSRKTIEDIYPLSPMQQGMLFHALSVSGAGAYFVALTATVRGALDVPAFARAFQDVLARHPVLRTAFVWEGVDEPLQVVRTKVRLPLDEVDLRDLPPEAQEERFAALVQADRARGFDLAKPPLLRVTLARLAEGTYRLLWSRHHLLLDGWSTALVLGEVFELYEAHAAGRAIELTPRRPFGEYVAWLGQQDRARAEAFFRAELRGFTSPTPLGVAGPAADGAPLEPGEACVDLPQSSFGKIAQFAKKYRLTLGTLVQGAFALLLQRHAGEDDVVFGATTSGRGAAIPGIDAMIGLFINTLPIRARTTDADTVVPWLTALQSKQAELREVEHTPLADVQRFSEVPRGTGLFESVVIFESFPVEDLVKRGLRGVTLLDAETTERTHYPLALFASAGETLRLRLQHDARRIDRGAAARMLAHLTNLLTALATDPDARVCELSPLGAEERRALLFAWNDTAEPYPEHACVHELFAAEAQRRPDSVAVLSGDHRWTYRELDERSNRVARRLSDLGVGPESLVGLCVERSLEMLAALLGILKAGGSYLPIDPGYPEERVTFLLEDSGTTVLVTQESLLARLPPFAGRTLVLDTDAQAIARESAAPLPRTATPDHRAYVIYTSGSTGRPKGVEIQHRALVNFLATMQRRPGIAATDTLVAVTSLSFDIAGLELYLPLIAGASVDIVPREVAADGARLAARLDASRATLFQATPATYRVLLEAGWKGREGLTLLCGGEALPPALAASLLGKGAALWNMFGPTETTIWSSIHRVDDVAHGVPIGRPIGNTSLHVLDPRGEPVPLGVPGELYIGGHGLARGYLGRPELTAERFVESRLAELRGERLYRTGDLVRRLPEGDIEFLGRLDHQVKIRGHRVELGEIEAALGRHPAIREAVVVAREAESGEERLIACLVLSGAPVALAELRLHLAASLPDYMVPAAFVVLPSLPLTPNGKVDRKALPPAREAREAAADHVAPSSDTERALAAIWESVLRVPEVGVHDGFFELGGDSILSIQVTSRARRAGLAVDPDMLFRHPTIASLAGALAGPVAAEVAPARAPRRAEIPPGVLAQTGLALDDIEDVHPLSPVQEGMLFHTLESPRSGVYFEQIEATITGLDAAAFEEAFHEVLRRTPVLRTAFLWEGVDRPVAVVLRSAPVHVETDDLRGLSADDQRARIEALVAAARERGFDPSRAPLLRLFLVRTGDLEHRFLFCFHHLLLDGWSIQLLFGDLFRLYAARTGGQPFEPAARAPFGDHARWLSAVDLGPARAFFRAELEGFRAPTSLAALERAGGAGPREEPFGVATASLSEGATAALRRHVRSHGLTTSTALQGAFALALGALAGQRDIVFGATVSGRSAPVAGIESMIGVFINTLPVRVRMESGQSVTAFLLGLQDRQARARALEHMPLVEVRAESEVPRGLPLFEALLVFENYPIDTSLRAADASLGVRDAVFRERTSYPLTITGSSGEALALEASHDRRRFDDAKVAGLLGRMAALLEAIASSDDRSISDLAGPLPDTSAEAAAPATLLRAPHVAPRGPVEQALALVFADVLGATDVSADDDFFALGGHSLLATRAVSRIRSALGVSVDLRDLFDAPRLSDLARRIAGRVQGMAGPDQPVIPRASRAAALPLSFGQERLWFLDQLHPGSPAYNMPAALRLRGTLDSAALERALAALVLRHEVLRTSFTSEGGLPVQVFHDGATLELPFTDLSSLPPEARQSALHAAIAREAAASIRLAQAPLARARLVHVARDEHVLLFTIHHIVADAWSIGILVREVLALYAAALEQGTAEGALAAAALPALTIQYADYAAWQRARLTDEALASEVMRASEALAGAKATLDLPADRPRPASQSQRGARTAFSLGASRSRALSDLCRREGITLHMLAVAAFGALAYRTTGQDDILVGASVADRRHPETEPLIGYFLNQVVVRVRLSAGITFRELVARVREATLGAYAHQDVPFERLVDAMKPPRDPSRTPLVQVMVEAPGAPAPPLALPGLAIEPLPPAHATSRFDLTLSVSEGPDGVAGTLEYATDLFDAATIDRMIEHLVALLDGAAAHPDCPAGNLPLMAEEERQTLLVAWNDTGGPSPAKRLVHELFEAAVDASPDAVAAVSGQQSITYRELDEQANRLAHHLRQRGAGPDVLVGLCLPRTMDLVTGILGVLKAGAAYVPLDPTYPAERLRWMLTDCHAPIVVTTEALAAALPEGPHQHVCLDVDAAEIAKNATSRPGVSGSPDHLAYVIYTSGSTGTPKGALVHHGGLVHYLAWAVRAYDVASGKGAPVHSSMSFDLTVTSLFAPLLAGRTVTLLPEEGAIDALAAALRSGEGQSLVKLTPSHLDVLRHVIPSSEAAGRARVLVIGGEQLSWESLAFFRENAPGTRLVNEYGPTETVVGCCVYDATAAPPGEGAVPIGKPITNTRLYVLDERLEPAPIGVPGELFIGGAGVGRGYLGRPGLTAERFVPDPFAHSKGARLYRTGDRVRWSPGGDLEFLGRLDHQVKIRGYRIELGEIEARLRQHPGVGEAVVTAREDAPGALRLAAYYVPRAGGAHARDLATFLSERLPAYMVPPVFVALEALPLTPNGKVDRARLPAPEARAEAHAAHAAPRGPVEEALCGIFTDVLGVSPIGIHDDFFELGGHSLLATQVTARVRAAFDVDLEVRAVFEEKTVAGLAALVEAALGAGQRSTAPRIERAPLGGEQALSFAQERLWFLHRLDPASPAYNVTAGVRLTGILDAEALEASLRAIVQRHEVLRTTFLRSRGRPFPVVHEASAPRLVTLDVSAQPEAERAIATREQGQALAAEPFDLERGPLVRATLVRLGPEEHVLFWSTHHIVSDAWSAGVVVRELVAFYRAFSRGEEPALAPLPIQYADYAAWQRGWLSGEALNREIAYWRAELAGAPEALDLPLDRPRPLVQSLRGAWHSFELGAELSRALAAHCREEGVTPFMALLAGFAALLARYSRQDDLVIGAPVANRTRAETEGLLGFFVNTLALRVRCGEGESWRGLLAGVKRTALSAYAHQELPFERLVEELRPRRDTSRSPLFQVAFTLQNTPAPPLSLPGLTASGVGVAGATSKFDLTLVMTEGPSGWTGTLEYATDLFDASTMARMAAHLRALLSAALARPDRPIAEHSLLSADERRELLSVSSGKQAEYPRSSTVHALFEEQAARSPGAVAVSFRGAELTYAGLERRANQLAHRLRALGVGRGSMVGLLAERSLEMVIATLGILKAGGAYVPFDTDQPDERLASLVADSGARVVVTTGSQPVPAGVTLVRLDDGIEREPVSPRDTGAEAGDPACMMYTSGSTGTPKGVVVPHRAIVRLVKGTDYIAFGPDEVFLQYAPIAFDAATLEIWGPLLNGGRLAVAPPEKMSFADLGDLLVRERVTSLWLTAGLFHAMIDAHPEGLRGLRQLLAGGEALSVPHVARALRELPGVRLVNGYGPTEGTTFTACHTITNAERASIPIGRPIANTRVYVLDGRGEPVPAGVPGELYIAGDGLSLGYWNRPELTAERFVRDPFSDEYAVMYRTGDLVRWLEGGALEYLGRLDQQVKIRGHRVESGEIEAALAGMPGVGEAVVALREDSTGEKRLLAYVVPAGGAQLDPAALRRLLAGKLPVYMVPSAIVVLDRLPLTPNGKVDRRALPAPAEGRGDEGRASPEGPAEEALAAIWRDLLGVAEVGAHDDFFELGGHSLLAARLVAEIEARMGAKVPLAALFRVRTLREIAALAAPERAEEGEWPALVPIQPRGSLPPFFAVSRPNINALGYLALGRHLGADLPLYGLQAELREQHETGPYTEAEYHEVAALYLREMRKVQPEGPYYLGGMCEGAHIAFAIAQQLEADGEEVALVAMFDAWPWENTHILPLLTVHNLNMRLSRLEQLRRAGRGDEVVEKLRSAVAQRLRGVAARAIGKTRRGGAEKVAPQPSAFHARMFPGPGFQPPQVRAKIGVFRVKNQPYWRVRDYQLGWAGRTAGGLEVHLIAGEHMTFLREPHVRVLAEKLRAVLDRLHAEHAARAERSRAAE